MMTMLDAVLLRRLQQQQFLVGNNQRMVMTTLDAAAAAEALAMAVSCWEPGWEHVWSFMMSIMACESQGINLNEQWIIPESWVPFNATQNRHFMAPIIACMHISFKWGGAWCHGCCWSCLPNWSWHKWVHEKRVCSGCYAMQIRDLPKSIGFCCTYWYTLYTITSCKLCRILDTFSRNLIAYIAYNLSACRNKQKNPANTPNAGMF